MSSLTRILAATDLSAPARHAVERAAMVSRDTAASLDLLHVANLAPLERLRQLMGVTPGDLEERVLDAARQRLGELVSAIQHRFGVAAHARVVSGALLTQILREAQQLPASLLVCGARGESVVRHFAVGTTALRLLNRIRCPVLIVRQRPHEDYRRTLVPIDFSESSPRALRDARRIAPGADIVLMHVLELPFEGHLRYASVDEQTIMRYRAVAGEEALRNLASLRDEAGLSADRTRLVVVHGDPGMRIVEHEQEYDCDLIVMGRHGTVLEDLFLGSVTRHVVAEADGDVLVSV